MSKVAWTALASSCAFTCGVVYYVHFTQKRDREQLREGVIIDLDRQQKKLQNIRQLELQSDLTKILRQQQREQDEKDRLQQIGNSSSSSSTASS